jgi:hypothetical protein
MTDHRSILDQPDVRELFARATSHEPAYDVAHGAALDAAVVGGRRRRFRATASRGLALVAVAATVVAGVALVRVPTAPTGPNVVAGSGSVIGLVDATPSVLPSAIGVDQNASPKPGHLNATLLPSVSPSPSLSATPSAPASPLPGATPATDAQATARLEAFVRDLAATANGTVTSLTHNQDPVMQGSGTYQQSAVIAHVTTASGAFDISAAAMHYGAFDVRTWTAGCTPSTVDAKPCTVVGSSAYDFMGSHDMSTNQGQKGRTTFQYVACSPDGSTLDALFDNYTEQPGHLKNVGPSWKAVGLDYPTLRAAARATALLR